MPGADADTAAEEYFSKAVAADPIDADYRFNLALALFKNGDSGGAARQLKDELQRRPSDAEAKSLLDMISRGVTAPSIAGPTAASGASLLPSLSRAFPLSESSGNTTKPPIVRWRWRSTNSMSSTWQTTKRVANIEFWDGEYCRLGCAQNAAKRTASQ